MRLLLAILALLLAAPVAAQESDRQMRQRLAWALSQARNAATAQATSASHLQAAYNAINARIVADSIADLTPPVPPADTVTPPPPPPPVDTVVTPPPPPVDTVTPPPPPPPPADGEWLVSPPASFRNYTSNPFNTLSYPGWGYSAYDSRSEIVATAIGNVARTYFPVWPSSPTLNPSLIGVNALPSGTREIFVRFRMELSPNWREQDPGHKVLHFNFGAHNLVLGRSHPATAWPEMYGANQGRWMTAPTGWGSEFNNPNRFNNVNHASAAWVAGRVQEIAVQLRLMSGPGANNGMIRLWVDGVMTAEWANIETPVSTLDNIGFAQVYGGGWNAITAAQHTDLDHVEVWIP